MRVKVYVLDSFTKAKSGGNPAGVVLGADGFSESDMKRIAMMAGFPETAFIQQSDKADFKTRFFTPNSEVDLCGHATIAAFSMLAKMGIIKEGKYMQETKAGILDIELHEDGKIFMTQNPPRFFERADRKNVVRCLNISEKQLLPELPIQIVSTGLRDILVPIKNMKTLLSIRPNFEEISKISKKYHSIGFHVFTLETKFGSTAHCRNFAPLYGIPEESATGTANGALGCYLFKHGVITKEQAGSLVFEQGYSIGRPSEILVKLDVEGNKIKQVKVGGIAGKTKETEVVIS
jgi:PhzF family phenazine biosynthesis protein